MANIFSKQGPHVYDSPKNGAAFLAYIYQLTRHPDEPIQILCQTKKPATARLKLSYGRHFVAEQGNPDGDPLFAPFSDIAKQVKIVVPANFPNLIHIQPGDYFAEAVHRLTPTVLFSYFHNVDTWLDSPSQLAHSKRWQPPLPEVYLPAIEQFTRLRVGRINAHSISTDICMLCKQ